MAQDPEFYEMVSRLPGAWLALIGERTREPYVGRSFELKRAARRVDAVVSPRDPDSRGRIFVIELFDRRDVEAEITLLRKTVEVAELLGAARDRIVPVVIHTEARFRRGVLEASITPHLVFEPERILLTSIRPSKLLRRGGPVLAMLPLVGATRTVRREAAGWRRAIRAAATMSPEERREAERVFMLFLAGRLGASDVRGLFAGEDGNMLMRLRDTATGKAMIAEENAKVLRRVLANCLRRFDLPVRSAVVRAIPDAALEDVVNRVVLAKTPDEARVIVGLPERRTPRKRASSVRR